MCGSTRLSFLLGAGILLISTISFALSLASLYDPSLPLEVLNATSFQKVILNKENAWLVQFYNHWCGHCIKFSPIFKAFANDVAGWKPVISLAVIDCVDYMQTCRTYGINSYPTIKFFRAHSTVHDRGVEVETRHNLDQLRHQAVDLVDSKDAYRGQRPANWPQFEPLLGLRSIEDLWQNAPAKTDTQILVVERNASYIGKEVTLELSSRRSIYVRRLVVSSDSSWLESLLPQEPDASDVRWADLYALHRNGSTTRILRVNEENGSRELVLQALQPYIRAASSTPTQTPPTTELPQEITQVDTSRVYLADLNNALAYSLRQEVAGHELLNQTELAALVRFVDILLKYFPGSDSMKQVLQNLHTFVTSGADSLRGEDLSSFLNKQVALPAVGVYEGCRGSRPGLRGYPCALWMLFHSLTVSAYHMSGGYPLGRAASGADVLQAIRDYVAYFFSCRYCAAHFGEMAKDLDSEVHTTRDAILWLWRAHNKVNARLAGDISEDPLHPKQPFPPASLCSDCREGTQWNEQHSLSFLLHFYSPDGLVPVGRSPLVLLLLGLLILALVATACVRRRLCLTLWKALHRWYRLPTRYSSYAARLA